MDWNSRVLGTIQKRSASQPLDRAGRGIGLAVQFFPGLDDADPLYVQYSYAKAHKAAQTRLVYGCNSTIVTAGSRQVKDAGDAMSIQTFGTARRTDLVPTPKSLLDFEGVLTTKDADRDGDELVPEGADLDEKMPLLWQHFPPEVVGKYVRLLHRDTKEIVNHYAIADTRLGGDAATLVEFGALRLSHGFVAKEAMPIGSVPDDITEEELAKIGWRVSKYHVMESSLVSIPSNIGAIITAWSRAKLTHPLVKGYAQALHKSLPATVTGGWQQPQVNVNIMLDKSMVDGLTAKAAEADATKAAAEIEAKKTEAEKSAAAADAGDEATQNTTEEVEGPAAVTIKEIKELIDQASKLTWNDDEATNRLSVLSGMADTVSAELAAHTAKLQDCAEEEDLAGVMASVTDMIGDNIQTLSAMRDEAERIMGLDEIPDGAEQLLGDMQDKIGQILSCLQEMVNEGQSTVDDANGGDPGGETPDMANILAANSDDGAPGSGSPNSPGDMKSLDVDVLAMGFLGHLLEGKQPNRFVLENIRAACDELLVA